MSDATNYCGSEAARGVPLLKRTPPWWKSDEHILITSDNTDEVVRWLEQRLPQGAQVVPGEPVAGVAVNIGVTGLPRGPQGWTRGWDGDYFGFNKTGDLYTRPPMGAELVVNALLDVDRLPARLAAAMPVGGSVRDAYFQSAAATFLHVLARAAASADDADVALASVRSWLHSDLVEPVQLLEQHGDHELAMRLISHQNGAAETRSAVGSEAVIALDALQRLAKHPA